MSDYLIHYGVPGMKWGVRRYQPYGEGGYNPNGIVQRKRTAPRNSMVEDPTRRSSRGKRGVITENPNFNNHRRSLKEMKYYKRNGELTRAGEKRKSTMDYMSQYAKRKAKEKEQDAKNSFEDSKTFEKEYREMYTTKGGTKRYLDENFGKDWHDKDYMKTVFEIDDVNKWAKDTIKSDLKGIADYRNERYKTQMDEAKMWTNHSKEWSSIKVSDISRKQYKNAKKIMKLDKKGH